MRSQTSSSFLEALCGKSVVRKETEGLAING